MANLKSPVKAIHAFCVDCMGGHESYIKTCTTDTCPLHPFRLGKNPYLKRELTPEQRATMVARLAAGKQRKLEEAQHE